MFSTGRKADPVKRGSMLAISQSELDLILSEAASSAADSDLGFFSKPFRINFREY